MGRPSLLRGVPEVRKKYRVVTPSERGPKRLSGAKRLLMVFGIEFGHEAEPTHGTNRRDSAYNRICNARLH
jgi:hypothetical protein